MTDAGSPEGGWTAWLADWNAELLAALDLDTRNAFLDPARIRPLAERGQLGSPPAGAEALARLEARLGMPLPPSYRSFLAASNGFVQAGMIVPGLLPAASVGWLRDAEPDLVEAYDDPAIADTAELLRSALLISERELIGTAVYLLDPRRPATDGEWPAILFAHWSPEVDPYPSFAALMEAERASLKAAASPGLRPPGPLAGPAWPGLRHLLSWIFRGSR